MSTFAELREIVLIYLQQNVNLSDPFPGSAVSADEKAAMVDQAILRAANNARKRAERLNDWVLTQISSTATVPAGEAISLLQHTDKEDDTVTFDYKNIVEVTSDGWPIHLAGELSRLRKKYMKARSCPRKIYGVSFNNHFRLKPACDEDKELDFYGHRWLDDYNLDPVVANGYEPTGTLTPDITSVRFEEQPTLINSKKWYSTGNVTLVIEEGAVFHPELAGVGVIVWDGELWKLDWFPTTDPDDRQGWFNSTDDPTPPTSGYTAFGGTSGTLGLSPYETSETPDGSLITDFFLQHGMDYMMWATLVECNHWAKIFVPRQEGNLAPPERERDRCLSELLTWDNNMLDAQTNFGAR